jgi:hypothetical protein
MRSGAVDDRARRPASRARARARQLPSFRLLELASFAHSLVYAGLLVFFVGPENATATRILGWTHGLMWIAMSLLTIVAARRRTIPFWLAVVVAVVGGLGPFAGSVGFVVEDRRRRRNAVI